MMTEQEHLQQQIKEKIQRVGEQIQNGNAASDNPLQALADTLMDYFADSGAVNYLEQRFSDIDNPDRNFVVTMQLAKGLTPAAKLAASEETNGELIDALTETNKLLQTLSDAVTRLEFPLESPELEVTLLQIEKNRSLIEDSNN